MFETLEKRQMFAAGGGELAFQASSATRPLPDENPPICYASPEQRVFKSESSSDGTVTANEIPEHTIA